MSGSTIGGIAGGIIGFVVTGFNPAGAQWGFMIGSAVGAIVDPEKIEGPRLKDASNQTANDGIPRTYGYGRFPSTGNVIWRDIVKEVKNTESGKGGPEVTTYTYTRSYAIAVCKGPISGYLIIKRNGKIVYDARPDSELTALGYTSDMISETRAAQAKFMEVCTFYFGDQIAPDPTIVAVKGAGNVPNYTGTAYIVLTDDETREGEIAQYEFVVADCGEVHEDVDVPATLLVTGGYGGEGVPMFAQAEAAEVPVFSTIPQSAGADLADTLPVYYDGVWLAVGEGSTRYSLGTVNEWETGAIPFASDARTYSLEGGPAGWLVSNFESPKDEIAIAFDPPVNFTLYEYTATRAGDSPWNTGAMSMCRYTGGYYYGVYGGTTPGQLFRSQDLSAEWEGLYKRGDDGPSNGNTITVFFDICYFKGALYATVQWRPLSDQRAQLKRSIDGGWTWPELLIDTDLDALDGPFQLEASDDFLLCLSWGARYVWTSADNFAEPRETGLATLRTSNRITETRGRQIKYSSPRFYLISGDAPGGEEAKGNKLVSTEQGLVFSELVSLPISNARGIAIGGDEVPSGYVAIPDAPGYYINTSTGVIVGPSGTSIDSCTPTLGSIVADQCNKRNITAIDVSELTDPVTGYRVASVTSPQQNIAGLMPAYFFDSSQFDGTIHFPKRGREATFALTIDDLVERDGDPIQWERTQEPELLRKLTVGYIDPATTFTPTTQEWERRAGTIKAQGEGTMELPVVMDADEAAQVADKAGKVAWAEAERCTFHVSRAWAKLVTAAVGTITDGDGVTYRVRITKIEDDGGIRMISAIRDRQTAYQSTVNGAQKPLPLFPGSTLRGPTLAAVMNMPAGLDTYDRPGLTWAAAGITDGWVGARLQVMRAGEWVTLGDITTPGSIGTLASALPAHSGDIDTANVMRIRMDDPLSSVTFTQLLNERNAVAILRADHTVEVVQFQNAVQDSGGVWECTTLIRGNLDTDPSGHDADAMVVVLDSAVQFVDLRPDDVGQTLTFRVVSLGTDPDAAPTFDITFPYIWSSTEWPVAYLEVEKDGDEFILTWIERRRLGTDANPIRSANWDGYAVRYEHSGGSGSVTVADPTHTFTLPGATDVDFYVAQRNRLTGLGPETMVNHE